MAEYLDNILGLTSETLPWRTFLGTAGLEIINGKTFIMSQGYKSGVNICYYVPPEGENHYFNDGDTVIISFSLDNYSRRATFGFRNYSGTTPGITQGHSPWQLTSIVAPSTWETYDSQEAGAYTSRGNANGLGQVTITMTAMGSADGINLHFICQDNNGSSTTAAGGTFTLNYISVKGAMPPTDPYSWAGHTHTSGKIPDSQHEIVQQNVDFPTLPTISFGDGGFVSIWTPELDEVQRIAGYAWNGNLLSIDFWKKLVASPLELIFGLQIIPYDFTDENSPYEYKHAPLTLGYINTQIDTHYIDEQFIEVDMGSVDLKEWAGAYLDYDPYTRFQIYLPYIGVKDLNADDCMNRTLSLKYRIDIATGACVAMIKCTDIAEDGEVDSIFYSFPGNCAAQIPVTASQQQSLIQSIVGIGIGVASAVSTIAAPPVALAAGAGAGAMAGMMGASGSPAAGALGLKSHYEHSGNMGSTIGFLGVQKPYILINRPRLAIPEDQNVYMGYPSFITESLGDLEGFTQVEIIHMENMTCTEEEVREIERLLVEGVIF